MPCCEPSVDTTKERKYDIDKKSKHFVFFGPSCSGDAFPLFESGAGFKVVSGRKWSIYNDTSDMELHVCFTFPKSVPVSKRKYSSTEVRNVGGKIECKLVAYPYETVPFVKFAKKGEYGSVSRSQLKPLSEANLRRLNAATFDTMMRETNAVVRVAGVSHSDEEILYKCRKSSTNFVDLRFKPHMQSLQRPQDKKSVKCREQVTWKRPAEGLPGKLGEHVRLFRDGVRPRSVQQGQLGDCWLMCSIAVIAEHTKLVEDLFRHPVSNSKMKKERKAGGYRVYLNKCGWWHNVIVDDYLPTIKRQVCFGRSGTDPFELWVPLIEKAYAKIHGSYANIIGGLALNALKDLTGFPAYSFDEVWREAVHDEEKAVAFFKQLRAHLKRGFVISIGTPGEDTSEYNNTGSDSGVKRKAAANAAFEAEYRQLGLGTGHAYSVLDVRQFRLPNIKLLRIRNPWGHGEWKGAWGASSPLWKKHPLVRRACKPEKQSGGTFWMEWKDVVRYFDGGCVCMVKRKWYDYRFRGSFEDIYPSFALRLDVDKKQEIFLTISQSDRRMLAADDPDQQYKGLLIAAGHTNPETGKTEVCALSTDFPDTHPPDTFSFSVTRDVSMQMFLSPENSPYYIIPRLMVASRAGLKKFTLGLLTPKEAKEKGFRVSFIRVSDTCDIFKNRRQFDVATQDPVHLQFQFKKRGGVPRLREGSSVGSSTPVKEEYPFPY